MEWGGGERGAGRVQRELMTGGGGGRVGREGGVVGGVGGGGVNSAQNIHTACGPHTDGTKLHWPQGTTVNRSQDELWGSVV